VNPIPFLLPPKFWQAFPVALAVTFGIGSVVVWNWYMLDQREQIDSQHRFELDVRALGDQLQARMKAYEMVLRGVSGTFAADKTQVSFAQWRAVVEQMRVEELYPGISSVAWSRYLRSDQLDAFITRVRADGRPNYQVVPEGQRAHYQPIEYVGPINERTHRVYGLDILTRKPQSDAITLAMDSGQAVLSVPLSDLYALSPETARRTGAIMYFPVYRSGSPPKTLEQRRSNFVGMTSAAFRGDELAEGVFAAVLPLFQIEVRDLTANLPLLDTRLIHESDTPRDWQPKFQTHLDVPLYSRTWRLNVTGTPVYEQGLLMRNHDLVLAMGLSLAVLAGLLAGGFVHHRNRQIRASQKVAERLQKQAGQLMLANRYKSEFLANMSHELRTPLNSILILSDQLRQNATGNLSEKQARHADIIHRAGSDLLQLINNVLDLAKVEAGRMQLSMEPLNLQDMLNDLDAAMRPLAEAKQLNLHIPKLTPEAGVPPRVYTDRVRLHQILRNLLSNAIKFTDEGQVQLTVGADTAQGDGRIMVFFIVHDTGVGISPEHHAQVFEAFQQLDGSTRRRFGGTGLGLAITRQLVQALDGTIALVSAPGQGSTFTVRLPMQGVLSLPDAETSSVDDNTAVVHEPTLQGHLLLVDDDIRNVYAMSALLDDFGLHISTASNGEEAIVRFRQAPVDLILMDMSMPVMDGYTATSLLKTRHGCTSPIIAMTAHAMKEDREKCLAAGADDYLAKPVTRAALRNLLKRWLPPTDDKSN